MFIFPIRGAFSCFFKINLDPLRQVAFAVFAGDRETATQQLTEAGLTVLHSGADQLTEEVRGRGEGEGGVGGG